MNIDKYENIKFKLLKSIRGSHTQIEVSRMLGFSFNQYSKWESGEKALSLFEFIDIGKVLKLDLGKMFKILFVISLDGIDEKDLFKIIYTKIGPADKSELADLLNVSQPTLYRWLNGNGILEFSLFLMWIDNRTQYLVDALSSLIGNSKTRNILFEETKVITRLRNSYYQYPYMPVVQYFFTTSRYKSLPDKSPCYIAQETGLTVKEVEDSIDVLLQLKIIKKVESHYENSLSTTNLGNMDMQGSARFAKYWTEKAVKRFDTDTGIPINTGDTSNMWLFRVIPVPEELDAEVKSRIALCFSEIFNLVSNSELPATNVKSVICHYYNVEDTPS